MKAKFQEGTLTSMTTVARRPTELPDSDVAFEQNSFPYNARIFNQVHCLPHYQCLVAPSQIVSERQSDEIFPVLAAITI